MAENKTETKTKKGRDEYNSTVLWAKRKKRRDEAQERDAKYAALSIPARIALAKNRRGESKRELARLEKLLAVAPKPAPKPVPAPVAPKTEDKPHSTPKSKVTRAAKAARPKKS